MLPEHLRRFAEAPDRYTQPSQDVERFADDRVCVIQGLTWAAVSDVRVETNELEALVAEVRERVPAERPTTWWLGPSSRPGDIVERLTALGFVPPSDGSTVLHALASITEPPPAPDIDVRRVSSYDEFVTATAVGWEAFEIPEERRERERAHLPAMYEALLQTAPRFFVAYIEGEAVGVGRSVYAERGVFLIGGAVVERARGRGVYRALVRARWDDAVERGTPAMIVEAKPDTSYPILKRLGFEEVCVVRRLQDPR